MPRGNGRGGRGGRGRGGGGRRGGRGGGARSAGRPPKATEQDTHANKPRECQQDAIAALKAAHEADRLECLKRSHGDSSNGDQNILEGPPAKKARVAPQQVVDEKGAEAEEAEQPNIALTWNGALSLARTGSARLDLFFSGLVRDADASKVERMVAASWKEDALHTVKLLMQARDCRNGKGEKAVVMHALVWLRTHKPLTYLLNLHRFLALGYYKDLLKMAVLVQERALPLLGKKHCAELEMLAEDLKHDYDAFQQWRTAQEQKEQKEKEASAETEVKAAATTSATAAVAVPMTMTDAAPSSATSDKPSSEEKSASSSMEETADEEVDGDWTLVSDKPASAPTPAKPEEKQHDEAKVKQLLASFYEGWGETDPEAPPAAAKPKPKNRKVAISLSAKWAPSEQTAFDRQHKLAHKLARMLFPGAKDADKQYRKMLSSLRAHLVIVERLMCENRWNEIVFAAVPSRAHNLLKKAFGRHETDRYKEYLSRVEKGEEKINTSVNYPHEMVQQCLDKSENRTVEVMWKTMLDKLKAAGTFKSALAMVDVSGSMTSSYFGSKTAPIYPAIALGIMVAELNEGAYHKQLLSFSSDPQWHQLEGESLFEQCHNLKRIDWGMSTDLNKALKMILRVACANQVKPVDMPRTLFIFSDMQFNSCGGDKTNFQQLRHDYDVYGYPLPQIVFWNLQGAVSDVPVTHDENGVALVSGFSTSLMTLIMEGKDLSPLSLLLEAIQGYEAEVDDSER